MRISETINNVIPPYRGSVASLFRHTHRQHPQALATPSSRSRREWWSAEFAQEINNKNNRGNCGVYIEMKLLKINRIRCSWFRSRICLFLVYYISLFFSFPFRFLLPSTTNENSFVTENGKNSVHRRTGAISWFMRILYIIFYHINENETNEFCNFICYAILPELDWLLPKIGKSINYFKYFWILVIGVM